MKLNLAKAESEMSHLEKWACVHESMHVFVCACLHKKN